MIWIFHDEKNLYTAKKPLKFIIDIQRFKTNVRWKEVCIDLKYHQFQIHRVLESIWLALSFLNFLKFISIGICKPYWRGGEEGLREFANNENHSGGTCKGGEATRNHQIWWMILKSYDWICLQDNSLKKKFQGSVDKLYFSKHFLLYAFSLPWRRDDLIENLIDRGKGLRFLVGNTKGSWVIDGKSVKLRFYFFWTAIREIKMTFPITTSERGKKFHRGVRQWWKVELRAGFSTEPRRVNRLIR